MRIDLRHILTAIAALVLTHVAFADIPLRGDLSRDGRLNADDVAAADVFFADPRAFWDANPGWTIETLRRAADVDGNGLVDAADQRALARAVRYAAPFNGEVGRQPVGEDGWTHVRPAFGSVVVYVSNSAGSNRNHGLSPDEPVATLERGYELLRDGHGDHMLLRAGDMWDMQTFRWRKSGQSHRHPMLLGAYGDGDRPTLVGDASHVINVEAHHLCIIGLRFTGPPRGSAVFTFNHGRQPWTDLLIEDCAIVGAYDGLNLQDLAASAVRRCIVTGTRRQGIFAGNTTDLAVEQNLFDRNGSNNILDHCAYLSGLSTRTRVIDNLFCRGANFGLKFNGPQVQGEIAGNVVFASRNGFNICANNAEKTVADTVIRDNVITEIGRDGQSIGMYVNHAHRVTLRDNLMANPTQQSEAVRLTGRAVGGVPNINGITFVGNTVYGFPGLLCNTADFAAVTLRGNTFATASRRRGALLAFDYDPLRPGAATFAANTYDGGDPAGPWFNVGGEDMTFDQWRNNVEHDAQHTTVAFADPSRGVAQYAESLGMSAEQLLENAAARPRGQWNPRFSAAAIAGYIRKGFAKP